jgi:hypothetical protein
VSNEGDTGIGDEAVEPFAAHSSHQTKWFGDHPVSQFHNIRW